MFINRNKQLALANVTGSQTVPVKRSRLSRKRIAIALMTVMLVLSAAMLFPQPAYAAGFLGIFPDIPRMIKEWLLDISASCFNVYNDIALEIGSSSLLSAPFSSMLGADMYSLTQTIHQTAIVPIAESILALFMLLQLVKISQRIDATATLPAVKDIVFLAVIYVLLHWFILNSLDIVQAIYGIVANDIIPDIGSAAENKAFFEGALSIDGISDAQWDEITIGGCFLTLIASILSMLTGIVAYLVAFIMAYARAWQIYVFAAFSSIPMALLGFDETRQMGIGFLKNFAAAALAGAVMMFLLVAYPHILSTMTLASGLTGDTAILFLLMGSGGLSGGVSAGALLSLLEWLGVTLLLVFGLIKSGAWAKEILGS